MEMENWGDQKNFSFPSYFFDWRWKSGGVPFFCFVKKKNERIENIVWVIYSHASITLKKKKLIVYMGKKKVYKNKK